jgi:hypothetical protein
MAYLAELLPEFIKGAKIRSPMWSKKAYIHFKDGKILDESGLPYTIPAIAFHIDDWELHQDSIDWDCIIKNKCLCWFWDDNFKEGAIINCLKSRGTEFLDVCNWAWSHCRPVRKDEVTFYEDIKK